MIPQEQLQYLKPLPEQTKRERMVKPKKTPSYKRIRLSKRARQNAWFGEQASRNMSKYTGPKGEKWVHKKMEDRKN